MIRNGYVNVEVAKLLMEKGLSYHCEYAWFSHSGDTAWHRRRFEQHEDFDIIVYCPYIWEADQMIQEKYGLYLVVFHTDEGWWGNISFMSDSYIWHKLNGHYETREDLYNDYIKYCLENN